jgi:hypothetical protein
VIYCLQPVDNYEGSLPLKGIMHATHGQPRTWSESPGKNQSNCSKPHLQDVVSSRRIVGRYSSWRSLKAHGRGFQSRHSLLDFNSAFSRTLWMLFGLRIFSPTFVPPYFGTSSRPATSSSRTSVLTPGSPQGSLQFGTDSSSRRRHVAKIRSPTFAEKRNFYFVQNCKFAQTHFSPDVGRLRLPTRCQMEVENGAIESHSRGLPNGANSSTCRRYDTKIRRPEDGVLSRLSCFFQDFLTTRSGARARRARFLLRAGTFHSCQQVVSSKSLVPLILCYIFPLLFLTFLTSIRQHVGKHERPTSGEKCICANLQ